MEDAELSELPAASPLRKLCRTTIDLARRLDPILAYTASEKGYANLLIKIRNGEPLKLHTTRIFELGEGLCRFESILTHLANEKGYADLLTQVRRGEPLKLYVTKMFKLGSLA